MYEEAQPARTMVLLGAGASRDAGLPLTTEFAVRLVAGMQRDLRVGSPKVQALNFVYGAMVNHRSEQGDDPLAAVNVEAMISAIRLLQHRESHEAAPFIRGWKPSVGAFRLPHGSTLAFTSDLQRGVDKAVGARFGSAADDLQRVIERIVDARRVGSGNGSLYAELERDLLQRVRDLLLQPEDTSYLSPIVELARDQPSGLDVATLNYDLTLETAAAALGVEVDTAVERWIPGTEPAFEHVDGRLNLIKVHGSINWRRHRRQAEWGARTLGSTIVERVDAFEYGDVPAIVIGDREKLSTDGPTLPLLRAFEAALWRAGRLVVVGYSFGDDHINAVIRNWIIADPTRTITVLDPGWSWNAGWGPGPDTFTAELNRHLGSSGSAAASPRLHVVLDTTRNGLTRALQEEPELGPVPRFTIHSYEEDGIVTITVTNRGRRLTSVAFSAVPRSTQHPGRWADHLEVQHPDARTDSTMSKTQVVPAFDLGESVEVRLRFADAAASDRAAHLSITAIDGSGEILVEFEEPRDAPGSGLQYQPLHA